jgi:hypothetical protein
MTLYPAARSTALVFLAATTGVFAGGWRLRVPSLNESAIAPAATGTEVLFILVVSSTCPGIDHPGIAPAIERARRAIERAAETNGKVFRWTCPDSVDSWLFA